MLQNLDLKKHGVWIVAAGLLVLFVIIKGRQAAATVAPAAAAPPLSSDPNIDATTGQDYSGEIQSIHDDIAVLAGTIGQYLSAPYNTASNTQVVGCPVGSAYQPDGSCAPCSGLPGYYIDSNGVCMLNPSAGGGTTTSGGGTTTGTGGTTSTPSSPNCPSGSAWDGSECQTCPPNYSCPGGSAPPVQIMPSQAR